jgi:hypothetical protein
VFLTNYFMLVGSGSAVSRMEAECSIFVTFQVLNLTSDESLPT